MKPKLLLRIAACIMLFHAVGHTTGVATWQKPGGDVPALLVRTMQDVQFSFMGKDNSTMAGFYSGFGYSATILLLFIAALLWTLSGWKDRSANKILWLTGFAILLLAVVEIIWFFPMAVAFSVVSAALVFVSIFLLNKSQPNHTKI